MPEERYLDDTPNKPPKVLKSPRLMFILTWWYGGDTPVVGGPIQDHLGNDIEDHTGAAITT